MLTTVATTSRPSSLEVADARFSHCCGPVPSIPKFNILGLVTKFGGINSHMAIRCSELSIPAVIGCGEQIFSDIISDQKKEIFIDCSASLIYSN